MKKGEAPQEPPKTGNLGSKWGFDCLKLFCRQLSFLLNRCSSEKDKAKGPGGSGAFYRGFSCRPLLSQRGRFRECGPSLLLTPADPLQEGEPSQ